MPESWFDWSLFLVPLGLIVPISLVALAAEAWKRRRDRRP